MTSRADVVFVADDYRFIALNVNNGRCIDDDPATADGYVTALDAAAGGLFGKSVLLLGLGPVGRAAARRLVRKGARVEVVEPNDERLQAALDIGLHIRPTTLDEGLVRCDLIFDATPAPDIIDVADVTERTIAAVPGIPSGFTAAAREAHGPAPHPRAAGSGRGGDGGAGAGVDHTAARAALGRAGRLSPSRVARTA